MKTFSDHVRKNIYACLFGPLAILPASIGYALFFKVYEPSANVDNFQIVPLFILIGLIVAYPITIFVGLPLSFILQNLGKFNLITMSSVVLIGSSIVTLSTGGGLHDFVFIAYFSLFVSTLCFYLHRVG